MSILNNDEKINLLIHYLDKHKPVYSNFTNEDFKNYLESIQIYLKTKEPIIQEAAISTCVMIASNRLIDPPKQ